MIDNLLNLFNVQSYYQQIFKGVIILVAVLWRRKTVVLKASANQHPG